MGSSSSGSDRAPEFDSGRLWTGIAAAVAVAVLIYAALAFFSDADATWEAMRKVPAGSYPILLALVFGCYVGRFARWQMYLQANGLHVEPMESFVVFLAGLAGTVTPGKLGEALKALLLARSPGLPPARTAPLVIAERITDLGAFAVLLALSAAAGAGARGGAVVVWSAVAATALATLLFSSQRPAHRIAALLPSAAGRKIREASDSMRTVLTPRLFLAGTAIGVLAWGLECVAFDLLLRRFGAATGLAFATWAFAAATVAGALSMLPGGLGAVEGSLALILVVEGGLPGPTAAAATMILRGCTIWFATVLGGTALLLWLHLYGRGGAKEAGEGGGA